MLRIGEIIVLDDDRKFVVVSSVTLDEKTYCYLAEFHNPDYTRICQVKGNNLMDVEDELLIDILTRMFVDNYNY